MMLRSNYSDTFGTTHLPAIYTVVFNSYKQKSDMIPILFNVQKSDRDIEQSTQYGGFDIANTMSEGESVSYQDVIQGYDKTFTHLKYGKGFKVSQEMIDDGKYLTMQKMSAALGKSHFEVKQIEAADIFNSGFSTSTSNPNGEALFSTTHALTRGGTEQNTLSVAADLSVTSLRQALSDLRDTRDSDNLRMNLKPKYLLTSGVGGTLYDAWELIRSKDRPDTSNRATNAFEIDGLEPIYWDYLTDTDAWYLVCEPSENGLVFMNRQDPELSSDYDFDAGAYKVKMLQRFSTGWIDWHGVYGSQGA